MVEIDFDRIQRELYTGVSCDTLDLLGFPEQAMEADVRPVSGAWWSPAKSGASSDMGWPVFAAGMRPVDSRGRSIVYDFDVPVICAGVEVRSGDLVFADSDGVAVIPQAIAEETLARALEKVQHENSTRRELEQGAYLRDVFAKYGVL